MATLDKYPLNRCNFLRWYSVTGSYVNNIGISSDLDPKEDPDQENHYLPMVTGDVIKFFINRIQPFALGDFSTLRLAFVNCGNVSGTVNGLFKVDSALEPDAYYIGGTFTVPNFPDAVYNLIIYRETTQEILLLSNPVRFINKRRWKRDTVLVTYRHSSSYAYFPYADLPDLVNQFRIDAYLQEPKYPVDDEQYRDSNRVLRSSVTEVTKIDEFETELWDADALQAGVIMFAHNDLKIDGVTYKALEPLDPEYFPPSNLLIARTKLSDQDFNFSTKIC